MRIKTLASHFLTCIVTLAALIGAQQAFSRQADAGAGASIFVDQVANRAVKGDRLPPVRALPNDARCKPPIDVVGRCFAGARLNPEPSLT